MQYTSPPPVSSDRILIILAFLCATALTWFRFDSLGMDEIELLHVIMSRTPISYIFQWTSTVESHPPTYYIFIKTLYWLLASDFGVKSVLSIWIFGGIYYTMAIAGLHSLRSKAIACCLIAINPIVIQYARIMRPHTLVFFLTAAALYQSIQYINKPSKRKLATLITINILGTMFHYLFLLNLCTQGLILVIFLKNVSFARRCMTATAICLASFLPIGYFYFSSMRNLNNMVLSNLTYQHVFLQLEIAYKTIVQSVMAGLVLPNPGLETATLLATTGLLVAALSSGRNERSRLLSILLIILFLPAVLLLAQRHGFVNYKYIPQAVIALTVLVSIALSRLGQAWRFALCLAILGVGTVCALNSRNPMLNYRQPSPFLETSRTLTQTLSEATFPSFQDDGAMEGFNHYYSEFVARDYILRREITPEMVYIDHILVGDRFYQKDIASFIQENGAPLRTVDGAAKLRIWRIDREPITHLTQFPSVIPISMKPHSFLRQVTTLCDMMFYSYFGDAVTPTTIGQPGKCSFLFANDSDTSPRYIGMVLDYENLGQGDSLVVKTRFDDEPEATLLASQGKTPCDRSFLAITRDRPFRTLEVTIEIVIRPITPKYPNWNHGLTRLKRLDVGFFDTNEPVNLYPQSFNRFKNSASLTADLNRMTPVITLSKTVKGMQERQEGENAYYTPESAGEGEIEVQLEDVGPYLVFFPRTSGNASIDVVETTGGVERPLFDMRGVEGEWSPQLEGYHFLVQPENVKIRTFRIRASGQGAQIWLRGGGLFHALAR